MCTVWSCKNDVSSHFTRQRRFPLSGRARQHSLLMPVPGDPWCKLSTAKRKREGESEKERMERKNVENSRSRWRKLLGLSRCLLSWLSFTRCTATMQSLKESHTHTRPQTLTWRLMFRCLEIFFFCPVSKLWTAANFMPIAKQKMKSNSTQSWRAKKLIGVKLTQVWPRRVNIFQVYRFEIH